MANRDQPAWETLALTVDRGVATLLLNRPETRNVIRGPMHDELVEAFHYLATAEGVRAIVLSGAGTDFCAGSDPHRLRQLTPDVYDQLFVHVRQLVTNILALDVPLIAAVNGSAIGVGATIALLCDVIVASDDAVIADTHVRFGLAAGDGGALAWALNAGLPAAKYHLMTGEPITAQRALELHLINEIHGRDALMGRAAEIAQQLADGPGQAIRATKRILNKVMEVVGAGVLEFAAEKERSTLHSHDHAEALAAMIEERPPSFTNR